MKWVTASIVLLGLSTAQAGFFDSIVEQVTSLFETHEEAPYTITRTAPGYEERTYPAQKWVCSSAEGSESEVMEPLFWKLFRYISGHNDRTAKIAMTIPVTTEYTVRGPTNKKFDMCFYLGVDHQENSPTPLDDTVHIQPRPELVVLTRTVGGYVETEAQWMEEAGKLAAIIQQNGETVSLNHQYWVGYDAPLKFWNRRNEVWFPVNT